MHLLLVEDEKNLLNVIKKRLIKEGMTVDALSDGLEAWDYLSAMRYDAVILDIMLPGMDGLTLLRRLREQGDKTPVLLLTARDGVNDRVAGLDSGADDYLTKPFDFEELLARLRALMRRSAGEAQNVLKAGALSMDLKTRQVYCFDRPINLSAREYDILQLLMRNRNAVLSRRQIEDNVWPDSLDIGSNIVDVYIRALRKKLGDASGLIQTLRGVGYVLRDES